MTQIGELPEALAQVEKIRSQLWIVTRGKADGWKKEYVGIREQLQRGMQQLFGAVDKWVTAHGNNADSQKLRDKINVYRTQLTRHQARWPAIIINPDDAEYRRSMSEVDAKFADLVSCVRSLPK